MPDISLIYCTGNVKKSYIGKAVFYDHLLILHKVQKKKEDYVVFIQKKARDHNLFYKY